MSYTIGTEASGNYPVEAKQLFLVITLNKQIESKFKTVVTFTLLNFKSQTNLSQCVKEVI